MIARTTTTGKPRCSAIIHDDATGGTRQCKRTATHYYPPTFHTSRPLLQCPSHVRYCDRPLGEM